MTLHLDRSGPPAAVGGPETSGGAAPHEATRPPRIGPRAVRSIGSPDVSVADLMAPPLPCVPGTMPFKELAMVFLRGEVPAVVVVGDDCEPVGIVTEADLLSLQAFAGLPAGDMALRWENDDTMARIATRHLGLTAETLMSKPVTVISSSADETEAARQFVTTGYKVLPVEENQVLVGSLSRGALLRRFDQSDEEVLGAVERVLSAEPRSHDVAAEVSEGVVSLAGPADNPRSAYEVERAVASVDGVVNVLWRAPTDRDCTERTK